MTVLSAGDWTKWVLLLQALLTGLIDLPIDNPFETRADTIPMLRDLTGEQGSGPQKEAGDSPSQLPIGRLSHFLSQWKVSSSDEWVLRTVGQGLTLEFHSTPPDHYIQCPMSRNQDKRNFMEAEIQHLLEIEAIEPVPSGQERTGVYSILFLVSKSSGGLRGILSLKSLNKFVLYRRFKMQSLNTILECIRDADVMTSVDLQEAYLHVPIHPAYRKFLWFAYANRHYQYKAMPFGLSSAPRTFTKLLAAVAAAIRLVPVRILCYLDDVLILSPSHQQAKWDLDTVCHTLGRHGFSINLKKSHLQPTPHASPIWGPSSTL